MAPTVGAAIVSAVGTVLVAIIGYFTARAATRKVTRVGKVVDAINDAVNNRHPSQPKMYDAVLAQGEELAEIKAHCHANTISVRKVQVRLDQHLKEHGEYDSDDSDNSESEVHDRADS